MNIIFRLSILGFLISFFACQSDVSDNSTTTSPESTQAPDANTSNDDADTKPKFKMITGPDAVSEEAPKKEIKSLAVEIPLTPDKKEGVSAFQEYTCMGNEPNWNIQIKPSGITWFLMGESRVNFPYKKPVEEGNSIVFQSKNDSGSITIKISKDQCPDSMADVMHPFTSEINVNGTIYKGCAQ
ncbi:MAG: hypothetical protein P1U70_10000 [Saprospiraceae bacterium]|nr:hypothetical protein [Saprospiraceae bacterium]